MRNICKIELGLIQEIGIFQRFETFRIACIRIELRYDSHSIHNALINAIKDAFYFLIRQNQKPAQVNVLNYLFVHQTNTFALNG